MFRLLFISLLLVQSSVLPSYTQTTSTSLRKYNDTILSKTIRTERSIVLVVAVATGVVIFSSIALGAATGAIIGYTITRTQPSGGEPIFFRISIFSLLHIFISPF